MLKDPGTYEIMTPQSVGGEARPIVVSDVDAFAELPDEVAVKVTPDEREVDSLAAALLRLTEDSASREAMSRAAVSAWGSRCSCARMFATASGCEM